MKLAEKHIGTFLISIAIFLVFGNVAIAAETFSTENKAAIVEVFQNDDNGKPFVFDEICIGEISQTVSQNEYAGFGFLGIFYSSKDFPNAKVTSLLKCSYSSIDKREIIFQYLFPFHFFW
ncbi:hypothetical protein [Aequorivita sublithincola]|uniref:hypothetical protein n=1 Tax=Aequorivita sublithincola TaxID=101385 RepID=UPI0003072481|nr:hypothetical protein [Aequorivita sublithincola]